MPTLRQELRRHLCLNIDLQHIISYPAVCDVLSDAKIESVITESDIEPFRKFEVIQKITNGGRRLFATLIWIGNIDIFSNFVTQDTQGTQLDSKLPLALADVEKYFGKDKLELRLEELKGQTDGDSDEVSMLADNIADVQELASTFADAQYIFALPRFERNTTHRHIDDFMRLPFIGQTRLGDGGYGDVYKVQLASSFYGPGLPNDTWIVRKELKLNDSPFEKELSCLATLRLIQHPNILELYCSYTHRGKHNFLFPVAQGGDLDSLLSQSERPTTLHSEESFYVGLSGLASALESLHFYQFDALNIQYICYHQDLKPKNILINGSNFILSDFGLSKLKQVQINSKSTFQSRQDPYTAPECEDLFTLDRLPVGRASDVWSFGCILLVVLVYLREGPDGVREFKNQRKVIVPTEYGQMAFFTFHAGASRANDGVTARLATLESNATRGAKLLISLIRSILQLDPSRRPSISEALQKLRLASLVKSAEKVQDNFLKSKFRGKLEHDVEHISFDCWLTVLLDNAEPAKEITHTTESFSHAYETIQMLHSELQKIQDLQELTYPAFFPLRRLNDQLRVNLRGTHRQRIHSMVELKVMSSTDTIGGFSSIQSSTDSNFLLLSSIKYMTKLIDGDSEEVSISPDDITLTEEVTNAFSFGILDSDISPGKRNVVVEKLIYDSHWLDNTGKELFDRLKSILHLLQKKTEFRSLPYLGFYHNPRHSMFGLVYAFPPSPSGKAQKVVSLAKAIRSMEPVNFKHGRYISLSSRFQLALDLARAVFEFHKVGWLHKSISSFNILFFFSGSKDVRNLPSPYFVGFSCSRPQGNEQFSNKIYHHERVLEAYHHPTYRDQDNLRTRYRPEFDYYSLGLVLLEIGLWSPLEDNIKFEYSPQKARTHLLERRVPFLEGYMGRAYREAVETCLSDSLWHDGEEAEKVDLCFEKLVIARLLSCTV